MSLLVDIARLVPRLRFPMVEPRSGYWTDNPAWGRTLQTVFPSAAGQQMSVASSDKFPGVPKMHTIQLWRGDDRSVRNADVYARVSYGVGGSNNEFMLDWGAGAQFALVANSVRVDAVTYRPDGTQAYDGTGVPGVDPAPLVIAATFGAGSIGHGPPLTLTEPNQEVSFAGGGGIPIARNILVPDFARAFLVHSYNVGFAGAATLRGNTDPNQPTYLSFQCTNNIGSELAHGDCQVFAGAAGAVGMPIPAGTMQIQIANETSLAPALDPALNTNIRYTLQWVLSL